MTERSGLDQGVARIELAFTRVLALIEHDRAARRLAERRLVEQEIRLRDEFTAMMAGQEAAGAHMESRINTLETELARLREENSVLRLALRDGAVELDRILIPLYNCLES